MKKGTHILVAMACPFLVSACTDSALPSPVGPATSVPAGVDPTGERGLGARTAGAPTPVPFESMMGFVNPCTALPDSVTITGRLWIHEAAAVVRSEARVLTASGFEGTQRRTIVEKAGKIFKLSITAMLTNAFGDRIRIHFIMLVDLATGTTRVQQSGGPACLGV